MLRSPFACTVLAAAALSASVASAQEVAGAEQAKPAFNEVERGGYAGGQVGFLMLRAPGLRAGLATGTAMEVSLGYDFARWIGVGFFGLAIDAVPPAGYGGLGDGTAQGDFSGIMPGAEVRVHLPLADDQNGVDRLFLNLGVGAGVMFFQPRGLFPSGHAAAGKVNLGLEYFTRLRHFSLGLALDGLGALPHGGTLVGGSLSPFVRYSF